MQKSCGMRSSCYQKTEFHKACVVKSMVPVMKRACSRHVVAAARCACRWFSRLAIIYFTEGIYGIARAHHVKVYDMIRVRLVG